MQEAAKSVAQVKRETEGLSKDEAKAAQKAREAALERKEAWSTVGTGLLAYGAAVTGITAAVIKQGVSYNTLQQQSRAALTTILGGAEAANAQMDKLDDFARNSPFAKQVFIQAQQQLLGFGVEASRVIPILDGVQNAAAAVGGTNEDISRIVDALAKMQGTGRLAGDTLNQLGQYGIDAATIIGEQMGKSGEEIRLMASRPGGIPVEQIWDPLITGLNEKFGGAAEGVKNTFVGSVDRVRAAIRDLASDWTAWLVDPKAAEGGAAIVGLNKVADALRGFQSMPDPFKNILGGAVALSGAIALLAGGFITLAPRIVATQAAMTTLGVTMPRTTAALTATKNVLMGPWGIALAAATVGLGVWAAKQGESRARVEELTASLDAQTGAVTANTRELIAKELQDRGLLEAAQLLGIEYGVVTDAIMGDTAARRTLNEATAEAIRLEKEHTDAMMGGSAYKRQGDAARGLQDAMKGLGGELEQATADHEQLSSEVEGSAAAQDRAAEATAGLAAEQARLAEQAQIAADANLELANAVIEAANAALAASNSAIGYENALAKATEAVKENGRNLDITTEKGRENQSALNNVAAAALKLAEDNLKAGQSTDQVGRSMQAAREDFIATAMAMGANRAEAVRMADQYGLTKGTVDALSQSLDSVPSETVANITTNADIAIAKIAAVRAAIERVTGKHITFTTSFSGPGAAMLQRGQIGINADGGLWDKTRLGMVKQYASGGFFDGRIGAQQPQIRPYSSPRGLLWSEEGSGPWEAFISGHPAKRDRSLRIWLDVGRRLGAIAAHAEGGMQEYARAARYAGPGSSTATASTLARLDPRDITALASATARAVERGAYRGMAEIGRGL